MGPAVVNYRFQRLPSAFRYFPRAVFGRRTRWCPTGEEVPRLEGSVAAVRATRGHLARYREVCGFADDGCLPITYPHVIAMPLQFAILTHPRFVVRLMGLIHIANEIQQARPLPAGAVRPAQLDRGLPRLERGHEFDLFTSIEDAQGTAWLEKSTLLARRASGGKPASRSARQALRYEKPADGSRPSGRHRRAALAGPPLRLAVRRPQPDPPRRPRREAVRIRARGRARHVVDGARIRGARACRARAARAGQVEFKFPLFLPGRAARALGERRPRGVRAEGRRRATARTSRARRAAAEAMVRDADPRACAQPGEGRAVGSPSPTSSC